MGDKRGGMAHQKGGVYRKGGEGFERGVGDNPLHTMLIVLLSQDRLKILSAPIALIVSGI